MAKEVCRRNSLRRGTLADFRKMSLTPASARSAISMSSSSSGSDGAIPVLSTQKGNKTRRSQSVTLEAPRTPEGRKYRRGSGFAQVHRRSAPEVGASWRRVRRASGRLMSWSRLNSSASQETIKEVDKEKIRRQFRMRTHVLMALLQLHTRARQLLRHEPTYREQLKTLDALARETDKDKSFLMFDPHEFKASKQMRMTPEARRILQTVPEKRSPKDIYYATIALRGIPQMADYPLRMQNKLANHGHFECYDAGRMIVRQGTQPEAFYFVLYGTVMVAVTDEATRETQTKCYLKRGDNFGELAIINDSCRQSTVISRTYVELLSISVSTYKKIFMVAGVKEIHDPDHHDFMSELSFLRGWPLEMLGEDPKKLLFCYFKRGAVMVKDSNYSDWIYVVKSGSLRVLMVLENMKSTINPKTGRELPAEPTVSCHVKKNPNRFVTQSRNNRSDAKPAVSWTEHYNVEATTVGAGRPQSCRFRAKRVQSACSTSAGGRSRSAHLSDVTRRQVKSAGPASNRMRFCSTTQTRDYPPELASPVHHADQTDGFHDDVAEIQSMNGPNEADTNDHEKPFVEERRTFLDDLDSAFRNRKTKRNLKNPTVVHVQTLTKGQAFGLTTLVFDDQPSLSLVSNGAECVLISKSLYVQHCPKGFLPNLRNQLSPYPPESQLQQDLLTTINWQTFRNYTRNEVLRYKQTPCWP